MTIGDTSARLSVAMCTYNGERYVETQLRSFLEQTRPPDELVVSDDGSSDSTVAQVQAFVARAPFPVRVYRNEAPLGALANFEKAISLCEGEIIALSDQDDAWARDKVMRLQEVFGDSRVTAAFSDGELMDEHDRDIGVRLWQAVELPSRSLRHWERTLVRRLPSANLVTGAALSFRRELKPLIMPFPRGWVHDAWIALIAGATGCLHAIPEELIRYRIHSEQQIGLRLPPSLGERLALRRHHLQLVRRATTDRGERLEQISNHLQDAKTRLEELAPTTDVNAKLAAEINRRVRHFRTRAQLPTSDRPYRTAVSELASGRYHRYSNGFSSMAKDVILRRRQMAHGVGPGA